MTKPQNTPSGLSSSAPARFYYNNVKESLEMFAMDGEIVEDESSQKIEVGSLVSNIIDRYSDHEGKRLLESSYMPSDYSDEETDSLDRTQTLSAEEYFSQLIGSPKPQAWITGPDTLEKTTSARTNEVSDYDSSPNTDRDSTSALQPLCLPQQKATDGLEPLRFTQSKKTSLMPNSGITSELKLSLIAASIATPIIDDILERVDREINEKILPTTPPGSPPLLNVYSLDSDQSQLAGEDCCWGNDGAFTGCSIS